MKVYMYWESDQTLYIAKEKDLEDEDYELTKVPGVLFRLFRIAETLYWALAFKLAKYKYPD